mmetsp:Transcript_9613/g.14194  ORF Transcript_9613/g.14194 Transcript_9613/m.14194 type:complete len:351 (-) Transcript_9613:2489-3541(-)
MNRVLVIGGNGFLGRHIVDYLIDQKVPSISVFDIAKNACFDEEAKYHCLDHYVVGNLTKRQDVIDALELIKPDTIFHCATPPPFANPNLLRAVNVDGTKQLLDICEVNDYVKRMVLTASASVVYNGDDVFGADETTPYAKQGYNVYTDTKIAQEKMVLARDCKHLRTATVRPAAIFGPRDPLLTAGFINNIKGGKLKAYIGDGENIYDFTYVVNIAQAMHKAALRLVEHDEKVCGQAFFITNGEPWKFWYFAGRICEKYGFPRPYIRVPYSVMLVVSLLITALIWVLNIFGLKLSVPQFAEYDKLKYFTSTRYFCIDKAKAAFGYDPIPMEESFNRTMDYFMAQDKLKTS